MIKYSVLLLLVVIPFAFAEEYSITPIDDENLPGCQENNACWSDSTITINQYDTITWHNDKLYSIGVISGQIFDDNPGVQFDSGVILPSREFSFTFEESGEFSYFSPLQPWMSGIIIVNPSDLPDDYTPEPIVDNTINDITEPTCGSGTVLVNGYCSVISEPENNVMDSEPTCGKGTEMVDGFCKVVAEPQKNTLTTCGPGTLLNNGKCVAKSFVTDSNGGGCLIATAAYGTELAPQIQFLREIRDNALLPTASGESFMNSFNSIYYSFSPHVADLQRENPIFKEAVKLYITPMMYSLGMMEMADSTDSSVLLWGSFVLLINGLMYVGVPVGMIVTSRKLLYK